MTARTGEQMPLRPTGRGGVSARVPTTYRTRAHHPTSVTAPRRAVADAFCKEARLRPRHRFAEMGEEIQGLATSPLAARVETLPCVVAPSAQSCSPMADAPTIAITARAVLTCRTTPTRRRPTAIGALLHRITIGTRSQISLYGLDVLAMGTAAG
jgi:hypothetical protein